MGQEPDDQAVALADALDALFGGVGDLGQRCAGGLLAALLWVQPLTTAVLVQGAIAAVAFPLGYATVGLVLGVQRPANPIGWLYAASGLVWSLEMPFDRWLGRCSATTARCR